MHHTVCRLLNFEDNAKEKCLVWWQTRRYSISQNSVGTRCSLQGLHTATPVRCGSMQNVKWCCSVD